MKRFRLMLIVFLLALALPAGALAATSFSWTANTEPDVAGYRLYYKSKTAGTFTKIGTDIVGRTTVTATVTVPEPVGTDEYTVVATAFDAAGNESAKSVEATKDGATYFWKDITPPVPPSLLKVLQLLVDALNRIATALEQRV